MLTADVNTVEEPVTIFVPAVTLTVPVSAAVSTSTPELFTII